MNELRIDIPAPWRWVRKPRGVFRGKNMLTPMVMGFATALIGRTRMYVEVSHGTAIMGQNIYGLTFRRANGSAPNPDPSKAVHSIEAIAEILAEVDRAWVKSSGSWTP